MPTSVARDKSGGVLPRVAPDLGRRELSGPRHRARAPGARNCRLKSAAGGWVGGVQGDGQLTAHHAYQSLQVTVTKGHQGSGKGRNVQVFNICPKLLDLMGLRRLFTWVKRGDNWCQYRPPGQPKLARMDYSPPPASGVTRGQEPRSPEVK